MTSVKRGDGRLRRLGNRESGAWRRENRAQSQGSDTLRILRISPDAWFDQ